MSTDWIQRTSSLSAGERRKLVWQMGEPGAAAELSQFVEIAATDPDEHVRTYAIRAMEKNPTPLATEAILDLLGDEAEPVRIHALRALAKRSEAWSPDAVIALADDHDRAIRSLAAKALGAQRNEKSTAKLVTLLADSHPSVRLHAAEALGKIRDPSTWAAVRELASRENRFRRGSILMQLKLIPRPNDEVSNH